jgi:ribose transport system ATP-binding protein
MREDARMTDVKDQEMPKMLQMINISKVFPGVKALDRVHLELNKGEILGIVGENGAGKSTLMKILGGVYIPDGGTLQIDGDKVEINDVETATKLGIAFVHQELNLSDNLDVAANIFLGREPREKRWPHLIDRKKINDDAAALLERVDVQCLPTDLVSTLSLGTQQMIEIAKSLSVDARILIMDEPTSSLTLHETDQLFQVIKDLKSQGISIVYISHRMSELKELADRVTVMRDGAVSGHLSRDEINTDSMIKLMVGRDVDKFYHKENRDPGDPILEIRDLVTKAYPGHKSSLVVRKGEILVIAGLIGAGRSELLQAAFGIDEKLGGEVYLDGKLLDIRKAKDAIDYGIGLVPENRKEHGLIIEQDIIENIALPGLATTNKMKMVQYADCQKTATDMTKRLDVRTPSIAQIVQKLSGGNQQKVVLSKWLSLNPSVLFLDEPTRGIDVVAKEEIYRLMELLALEGITMLVVSSEMQEVLGIADRIAVMHEGRIVGVLEPNEFDEEKIMYMATGGK